MSRFFVFTGPESSGKTRLSTALATKMQLPLVGEYARIYFDDGPRQYAESDIDHIGHHQEQLEKEATQPTVICDTDLLTCLIWKKVVFEVWDEKMATKISSYTDRQYLLCTPEIPWETDPLRQNPHDRDKLFAMYLDTLERFNQPYTIISGSDFEQRLLKASHFLLNTA